MKHKIIGICAGVGVSILGILIVLTGSVPAWLKIQYVFACALLGIAVSYIGDRI